MATNIKRTPFQIMKDVLFALVLREYLTRFGSRRMGAFWEIFEPMANIAFMMFVFTMIRARTMPGMDYSLFVLTGIIPFFLMRNIVFKLMDSVDANQALFSYPHIKILDTYIARVLVECSISSVVYMIFIFIFGYWLNYDVLIAHPVEWFFALLIGVTFSFGIGIISSIVTQVFPNIKSFIRLLFLPLYLMSGVIFPLWVVPDKYLPWLLWNPFAHIISNIREGVFTYYPGINGVTWTYPISITLTSLFIGLGLYRLRRERLLVR